MIVAITVKLHCGGRRNNNAHSVELKLPISAAARYLLLSTIKTACCNQLQRQRHNTLYERNLEFATVSNYGWKHLPHDRLELSGQQLTLHAVVVPAALAATPPGDPPVDPRRQVLLMELVSKAIPWVYSSSKFTSTTNGGDTIEVEQQVWAPDIRPYLEAQLQGRMMEDPRFSAPLRCRVTCEDQMNTVFDQHVCDTVACIVRALGHDVEANKNELEGAQGQPDFLFTYNGQALLPGEGKLPTVTRSAQAIRPDSPKYLLKCAGQEAFYIEERGSSYGFLTYMHGTFFFRRTGDNKYALTESVPWFKEGEGVLAHLLYIVLKQIDVVNGIFDNGMWVPSGNGAQQQQQLLLLQQFPLPAGIAAAAGLSGAANAQPAGALQQQQLSWAQQVQVNDASAGCSDPTVPGSSMPQVEHVSFSQTTSARSSNSRSSALLEPEGRYMQFGRDDLQLTDIVVGWSQTGQVKLGMLHGTWCAVKVADVHNQKPEVQGMQHEVSMYLDDRVKGLQGAVLPRLVGCGYWKNGHLFFVATSYIDGCRKPGAATIAGAAAAEQALQRLHQQGLLHGDLHRSNVLLRCPGDGKWQAFLIDLGMCRQAEDHSEFEEEMRDLRDLFKVPETGSGDVTGFEEPEA